MVKYGTSPFLVSLAEGSRDGLFVLGSRRPAVSLSEAEVLVAQIAQHDRDSSVERLYHVEVERQRVDQDGQRDERGHEGDHVHQRESG